MYPGETPSLNFVRSLLQGGGALVGVAVAGYYVRRTIAGDDIVNEARMDGRTVVVTGATSGIGRQTALQCAQRGARVIMACRNMTQCEETRKFILSHAKQASVVCKHCDLASNKSIRKFAADINTNERRLDVLINNAGVMLCPHQKSADGIEMQLAVNHISRFLLTTLLLDKLKQCQASRIVNVVSMAHRRAAIDFDNLNSQRSYDRITAFGQSQLAAMLFTLEMSRRLQGTPVTCNAVYPGICSTRINRHQWIYDSWPMRTLLAPVHALFVRSAAQGAGNVVFAASDPAVAVYSGEYFSNIDVAAISKQALDKQLASRLWTVSEQLLSAN